MWEQGRFEIRQGQEQGREQEQKDQQQQQQHSGTGSENGEGTGNMIKSNKSTTNITQAAHIQDGLGITRAK